jgi:hypothetical protein
MNTLYGCTPLTLLYPSLLALMHARLGEEIVICRQVGRQVYDGLGVFKQKWYPAAGFPSTSDPRGIAFGGPKNTNEETSQLQRSPTLLG